MKAIVHETYGSPDVLQLREVPKPVVDADSVLVRVRAASVNAADWHIMRGLPYLLRMSSGLRKPKRLVAGVDMAGHVEAVRKNVSQFRAGDEVFCHRGGAFAQYLCAAENNVAPKPGNPTFEEGP